MPENHGVLVYCETSHAKLTPLAIELLGAGSRLATALGGALHAVLIGQGIRPLSAEAIAYGARSVSVVDDASLAEYSAEPYSIILEKIIRQAGPEIVLLGQTSAGRDLAPVLAFHLETAATMDCVGLEIAADNRRLLMTRPVYGGNALAVQVIETNPQIATVRPKSFPPPARDSSRRGEVVDVAAGIDPAVLKTRVTERKIEAAAGIKLEDARVVVAGGRGMGGAAGFTQLEELAGVLKGAVGATRPPCDKQWTAETRQIGLTGKVVSPDLYIAVGLSGASQHLSGFSSSKVIVAINKDPEANIFKVARYGILGDWKTELPALIAKLKEGQG